MSRGDKKPPASRLSGWGRTFVPGREVLDEDLRRSARSLRLMRGLGRSYGDASLPPAGSSVVAGCAFADRILAFDSDSGVLRAEAGLSLEQIRDIFLPRGFFTPVSPGTQFVTLGGMVAADVHGKNHHVAGTIGRWVRALRLLLADGSVIECSREENSDLFLATLGGMGTTGHILEVELQLEKVPSPWIRRESYRIDSLQGLLDGLKDTGQKWPFTVAWMDTVTQRGGRTLGRGILYVGRWAEPDEAPRKAPSSRFSVSMPLELPSGLLNRFTLGIFNRLVYGSHWRKRRRDCVSAETFFYPLDRIRKWNLAYGKRGVTQHQSVIPSEHGADGIREMLDVLAKTGACSFLTVVKDCGEEGDGILSFPKPGMSLALDLPITDRTQKVVDALNACVVRRGGRIYLAKDGFTRREDFEAMEKRLPSFLDVKQRWDPNGFFASAQSERLFPATATSAPSASTETHKVQAELVS